MEEKIIIKSKLKNVKPFCIGLPVFGVVIFVLYLIYATIKSNSKSWNEGETLVESFMDVIKYDGSMIIFILIILVFAIVGFLFYKGWSQIEMTVSDKRVFGCAAFGKRVDLPLDAISAVGTSVFNGIAITSASGAIKFYMIDNRNDIHEAVSKLLVERQGKEKAVTTTTIKQEIPQSNADELKKYKELLDSGVITQEEFNAKKKQLLGL